VDTAVLGALGEKHQPSLLSAGGVSGGLTGIGPPVFFAILYSGTLAAGFANVIVFHGVKLLGPTRITALQFLVPFIAVVMAAVALGEPITAPQKTASSPE